MNTSKLSSKYQIVVPRAVRQIMKLKAGMSVALYPLDDNRAILLKQPVNYVQALEGLGQEVWQSLGGADKYIKDRRADRILWSK